MLHTHNKSRNFLKTPFVFILIVVLVRLNPVYGFNSESTTNTKPVGRDSQLYIDSLNIESRDLTFVNPMKSLELAKEALALSINYERGTAYAYRNIGNVYVLNEVYSPGTPYLKNAEDIFTRIKDSVGLADIYISYGHMYRRLHDTKEEVQNFEKAYILYKGMDYPDRLAICATNLAESYFSEGNYLKSKDLVNEAIFLSTETNQLSVLSVCYKLNGELELQDGRVQSAADFFHKVLNLTEVLGENSQKIATIESLLQLAKLSGDAKQSEQQYELLIKALNYSLQNELSSNIIDVYNLLISFHIHNGQLEEAGRCMSELNSKSREINDSRMQDQSNLVNNLINAHDLEKENKFLEITNQMQRDRLLVRNIFLIIIALFAIAILFFLLNFIRANKKIKFQNKELYQQNLLINEQKKELAELLLNRDKLFSIIAHDLRNPFNSILLTLEILSESLKEKGDPETKKRVDRITRTAVSTYDLLEKLLLWARNQKENVHPDKRELILNEVVYDAIDLLKETAVLKKITLLNTVDASIKVIGDSNMLLTVIRNLVQNALKYTNENGLVIIKAEPDGRQIKVSVSDNGVGIKESIIPILFTFEKEKVRNGTSGETGTGLGLALCKQFVEKNDGKIWVETTDGNGTTITFTIPELNV